MIDRYISLKLNLIVLGLLDKLLDTQLIWISAKYWSFIV